MPKYSTSEKLVYPLAGCQCLTNCRNRYSRGRWSSHAHRQSRGRINGWRCGGGCGIGINGQPSHRINLWRAGSHRSLRESLLRIGCLRPLPGLFRGFIIQHLANQQSHYAANCRAFSAFLAIGSDNPAHCGADCHRGRTHRPAGLRPGRRCRLWLLGIGNTRGVQARKRQTAKGAKEILRLHLIGERNDSK